MDQSWPNKRIEELVESVGTGGGLSKEEIKEAARQVVFAEAEGFFKLFTDENPHHIPATQEEDDDDD